MALAGFSAGEAEGLRRAMSRKRSEKAILAYREQFIAGARERGVAPEVAERVFEQIRGFSGFGFPKAHAVAFGLLAYQSTWLGPTTPPSSSARCSTSSRWASTRPTRWCMKRSVVGSRCWRRTRDGRRGGAADRRGGIARGRRAVRGRGGVPMSRQALDRPRLQRGARQEDDPGARPRRARAGISGGRGTGVGRGAPGADRRSGPRGRELQRLRRGRQGGRGVHRREDPERTDAARIAVRESGAPVCPR